MNWIDKILSREKGYNYIFPYSNNPELRKQELIQNLENGILFEDLELFVEWNVPFKNLQRYVWKRQKRKSYRDTGHHVILDGIEVFLAPHHAMVNSLPFIDISSFLGFDDQGHQRFLEVNSHLVDRFGEPTEHENTLPYDFYGDKSARWTYRKFQISLNVWERFAVHYSLQIRLLTDRTTANMGFASAGATNNS